MPKYIPQSKSGKGMWLTWDGSASGSKRKANENLKRIKKTDRLTHKKGTKTRYRMVRTVKR